MKYYLYVLLGIYNNKSVICQLDQTAERPSGHPIGRPFR